jgi:hypothetical protein
MLKYSNPKERTVTIQNMHTLSEYALFGNEQQAGAFRMHPAEAPSLFQLLLKSVTNLQKSSPSSYRLPHNLRQADSETLEDRFGNVLPPKVSTKKTHSGIVSQQ